MPTDSCLAHGDLLNSLIRKLVHFAQSALGEHGLQGSPLLGEACTWTPLNLNGAQETAPTEDTRGRAQTRSARSLTKEHRLPPGGEHCKAGQGWALGGATQAGHGFLRKIQGAQPQFTQRHRRL